MDRRRFVQSVAMTGALAVANNRVSAFAMDASKADAVRINIRPHEDAGPLPHAWEECVGSDRAIVGLREQWLSDLDRVKREIGFKSVRFHGLFNDEMGVWPLGAKQPNFLYVDMVFDAMLERGVRPFVELSFMPGALASGHNTAFFYKGNTTVPNDLAHWAELIRSLGEHCVARYGIKEVENWAFEVWNEPNLKFFWAGTQSDYFELYRHAVTALKSVNDRLRVGGPSTAQAAWVGDLLAFCAKEKLPIDFASTHIYPDDPQAAVFGEGAHYSFEEVIPRALEKVKGEVKASQFPSLPLYITEWSSQNPAFIAHTVKGTIGLADIMSYWTFDNVFEEMGIPRTFLNKNFGLIGLRGVPRTSFHTFALLHQLGDVRLATDEGPVIATRRKDSSLAVLVWNLIAQDPKQRTSMGDPLVQTGGTFAVQGDSKKFTLQVQGDHRRGRVNVTRVDNEHGDFNHAYQKMGSPAYPTAQQLAELKRASALPQPEIAHLDGDGQITISIPPNGIALLTLGAQRT
jgi:xylan 1,4-beta-xylosidase